jgi:S-DNA-T family DNA segregation ATPase FtsK/SpoIIIE
MFATLISLVILILTCAVLVIIAQRLEGGKQRKLLGILLGLLALLFLISQASFLIFPGQPGRNFGGLFGFYTTYAVYWLVGLYCFAIPGLLGYLCAIYFTRPENRDGYHLLYFIPIGIVVDAILALAFSSQPFGGRVGVIIGNFLLKFFGTVGTYVIIGFAILIIAFMMLKNLILPHKPTVTINQPEIPPAKLKKNKKEKVDVEEKSENSEAEDKTAENGDETGTEPKRRKRKEIPEVDFKTEYLKLLTDPVRTYSADTAMLQKEGELLTARLMEFGVSGKVINIESGPVISRFEFEPAPGIKVNRIANLDNDLALSLKATRIRIVAPIPGKSAVGIEVPNKERGLVYLKNCLLDQTFEEAGTPLSIVLGQDITGMPVSDDIALMPHMLVAGTTGSGKSVCINTIIASILYHATEKDVRFLMIDPKRLELPMYNPIPHLLRRAVTEPKEAVNELNRVVTIMEARYRDFARENVRDIDGYNEKMRKKGGDSKPYIVIIVDELADLMLTAPGEIEENITRLAQMSRAVGIHLVLATQRPSVDVITGLIKANFPCRIAFQVASKTDSRTILDMNGAESLLGRGDMLFLPPGKGTPVRLHGAYISTEEVVGISQLIARQHIYGLFRDVDADLNEIASAILDEELWSVFVDKEDPAFEEKKKALTNIIPSEKIEEIMQKGYYPDLGETENNVSQAGFTTEGEVDPMFPEAARLVHRHQVASVSLLQRRLNLGYARAGRIIDQLESAGVVEPFQGSKSRKVLVENPEELEAIIAKHYTP